MTVETQTMLVGIVARRPSVQLVLALREIDCATRLIDNRRDALRTLWAHPVDLVVIDDEDLPFDGFELIEALRGIARTPILLIRSGDGFGERRAALEAGATDVVFRPFDTLDLETRLRTFVDLAAIRARCDRDSRRGERAAADVTALARDTIRCLMLAAESRDDQAAGHLNRVAGYVIAIAEGLGLSSAEADDLGLASTLHDIGKIGVPDRILLKDGPLTDLERQAMEQHTLRGHRILQGSAAPLMQLAAGIALTHHERWDGTGYPQRLKGKDIPLAGRIVAVADVFDALSSARTYKPAWPIERARSYLQEHSGSHFDPACVDAFLARWGDVAGLSVPERVAA